VPVSGGGTTTASTAPTIPEHYEVKHTLLHKPIRFLHSRDEDAAWKRGSGIWTKWTRRGKKILRPSGASFGSGFGRR